MKQGKKPSLIVFDMDGVLVDVSSSYRETVRKTARLFFRDAPSYGELPDPLFPLEDLARLKQSGGLNNDWDLAAQVLSLLCALVKKPDSLSNVSISGIFKQMELSDLASFLRDTSMPLSELMARYGRRKDPLVEACFRGDVGTGNVIKQLFQEIYLGKTLFKAAYQREPSFFKGDGLINNERILVSVPVLEALATNNFLAVATGRPKFEAYYTLDLFSLRQYFQVIMTHDDCLREEERIFKERQERISLSKPNPFLLDAIADLSGGSFENSYYVGDMPDDMKAAKASKTGFLGVGFISPAADHASVRDALISAGASIVIDDLSQLTNIIP